MCRAMLSRSMQNVLPHNICDSKELIFMVSLRDTPARLNPQKEDSKKRIQK